MLLLAATILPADPEATTQAAAALGEPLYHVAWDRWLTFYNWQIAFRAFSTFFLILLLGLILTRIFKKQLQRTQLTQPTHWTLVAVAVYFFILAGHPVLMVDPYDILALIFHKILVAILLMVAVRYLDRLVILPLLTRIGGRPSRFVHQIIIAIISIFVIAGYCSWAFKIEISSFLAGSAVISIVLGLALQETLGNFFSGMVLQASVPFKTGDWIQIGTIEGRVVEMTWRAVTLLTKGNNHILIPNSTVSKEKILNFHAPSAATSVTVDVGLDYSVPPNTAKHVLAQAALDCPDILRTPHPVALLVAYADSSINYKLAFWIDNPELHGAIEETVRTNIWYRVSQANINIPFPVRTVELKRIAQREAHAADASHNLHLDAIRNAPMFSDLPHDLQENLADQARDFLLGAGQTLYRQGDPGNSMFIIQSGTISRTIHTTDPAHATRDIDAGDASAPALTGEGSALTGHPRGSTVRAKTDVRVIEIDRQHLKEIFTQNPALMSHFSDAVATRQKEIEDMLQKLGATHTDNEAESHAGTVLDRMRSLFTFGMR